MEHKIIHIHTYTLQTWLPTTVLGSTFSLNNCDVKTNLAASFACFQAYHWVLQVPKPHHMGLLKFITRRRIIIIQELSVRYSLLFALDLGLFCTSTRYSRRQPMQLIPHKEGRILHTSVVHPTYKSWNSTQHGGCHVSEHETRVILEIPNYSRPCHLTPNVLCDHNWLWATQFDPFDTKFLWFIGCFKHSSCSCSSLLCYATWIILIK